MSTEPKVRRIVSRISWVEILSALSRLHRENRLETHIYRSSVQALYQHFRLEYQLTEVDITVLELAGQLVQRHPLRAYDAVQLASALRVLQAYSRARSMRFHFVSADVRLSEVATLEGLRVINPQNES
jgi:predicted nucleic acid-binding protein